MAITLKKKKEEEPRGRHGAFRISRQFLIDVGDQFLMKIMRGKLIIIDDMLCRKEKALFYYAP